MLRLQVDQTTTLTQLGSLSAPSLIALCSLCDMAYFSTLHHSLYCILHLLALHQYASLLQHSLSKHCSKLAQSNTSEGKL